MATNHCFIHEADMKRKQLNDEEEAMTIRPDANDHEAGGSNNKVIDISNEE